MFKKSILAATAFAAAGLVASAASADITIATAGPMTGQYASFGQQMKAGAEQAVADINAAGGINGEKLVLKVGDDVCDPKQAVAVANGFVGEGVVFVAGHFCSGSSIPASAVYEEEGILQISPASTNPKLTDEGGPNVFRVCGRDDQQGLVAGGYLAKTHGGHNIAVLHDKTAYGKGLADATLAAMNAAGKKETMYEAYTAGEKDYSGYHTEAGLIVRQMRDQGMNTLLVSGDALVTKEYWDITGKAGEGTLMTFSPDPRKNAGAAPLVKTFRDKGIEPEGYVLYTYAAIQVFAQAATKAGSVDLDALLKAMKGANFDTVLGSLSFDDKGDVTLPGYVFYEWKNGNYNYVN